MCLSFLRPDADHDAVVRLLLCIGRVTVIQRVNPFARQYTGVIRRRMKVCDHSSCSDRRQYPRLIAVGKERIAGNQHHGSCDSASGVEQRHTQVKLGSVINAEDLQE